MLTTERAVLFVALSMVCCSYQGCDLQEPVIWGICLFPLISSHHILSSNVAFSEEKHSWLFVFLPTESNSFDSVWLFFWLIAPFLGSISLCPREWEQPLTPNSYMLGIWIQVYKVCDVKNYEKWASVLLLSIKSENLFI